MTPVDYDGICQNIYRQILRKFERSDHPDLRFIAKGAIREILDHDCLLQIFDSLKSVQQSEPATAWPDDFTRDEFAKRIEERKLCKLLAVLLFSSCSIRATRLFVQKLVFTETWPVAAVSGKLLGMLPAQRDDLLYLFEGDEIAADRIRSQQSSFCPVVIQKRTEVTVQNANDARLPYLGAETEIGRGAFGTVYAVRIAKRYIYNPATGSENAQPMDLARKDYEIDVDQSKLAQEEHKVIGKILESNAWKCENILQNVGSLRIGNTYSLFMPLAECDLRGFMTERKPEGPSTTKEKADIIGCAAGLAGALKFLHSEMKTSDLTEDLICYHMDLKPDNILVFHDTRPFHNGYIWKLSDFGMARVKVKGQKARNSEQNLTAWFKPKTPSTEPSPSATINRRGGGTYLGPESLSASASMKTPSDVWSLGCVVSVVFAYLGEGARGIESYKAERSKDQDDRDGMDRFFTVKPLLGCKLKRTVRSQHKHLVQTANSGERPLVKDFLNYLEHSVLKIEPDKRHSAAQVQEKLLETYQAYSKLEARAQDNRKSATGWKRKIFR